MNNTPREQAIGFIGLGQMGAAMAANLLKAGFCVIGYDIDSSKTAALVALGGQAAIGPADAARRASRVVSMVDTTAQAEEVIVGTGGIVSAAQPGDLVISMSTIEPMALRRMHGVLAAKGVDIIDAPVSGMDKGAREGTLRAFVGGTAAALEKARPVLKPMTSEITHFGAIGQGTVMKLVNNMLTQVNRIVTAEALVLGAAAGLDPQQMFDTITKASGNSVAFQAYAPKMLSGNFEGSRMDITFKDMELQTSLGKALKVPMFMGNIAQQVCQMGRAAGYGSEDGAAVVKVYEQFAGVSLSGAKPGKPKR